MDTSIGTVIAEKIKDFAEEGIPEVFDRDLSLGRIQPPARGNLVNVIVGVRRCGKTYRLYQEMRRIVAEGYPQDSILYFNFEDERLKPYEKELLQEVIEVFYARNPRARQEGAFFFFDEIQEVPDWGLFLRRMVDLQGDHLRDWLLFENAFNGSGLRVPRPRFAARALSSQLFRIRSLSGA